MKEEQIINYMTTKKYIENKYLCWDFVQDVYEDMFNYRLPDYPAGEVPAEFKNRLKTNLLYDRVEKENAQEGDLVIFSMFSDQHAGLMLNNNDFIHLTNTTVAVSQLNNLGANYAIYRIIREN